MFRLDFWVNLVIQCCLARWFCLHLYQSDSLPFLAFPSSTPLLTTCHFLLRYTPLTSLLLSLPLLATHLCRLQSPSTFN
jgi:hypothetical protein